MRLPPLLLLLPLGLTSASVFSTTSSDSSLQKDLNLTATADFPTAPIPAALKLVNRQSTPVDLKLVNGEEGPVTLQLVGGSLWDSVKGRSVRNLTSLKLGRVVVGGEEVSVPYNIDAVDLLEQDLLLNLAFIISTQTGELATVSAFNQTVSIVEPGTSIFDPKALFLYLILASGAVAVAHFIYNTYIAQSQPKRRRRDWPATKKVEKKSKVVEQKPVETETVVTTSSSTTRTFDESWIPEHHLTAAKTTGRKKSPSGRSRKAL